MYNARLRHAGNVSMKLYNVPRYTNIVIRDEDGNALELFLHTVDGMFSYCVDGHGNVIHLPAWIDVEIVGAKDES